MNNSAIYVTDKAFLHSHLFERSISKSSVERRNGGRALNRRTRPVAAHVTRPRPAGRSRGCAGSGAAQYVAEPHPALAVELDQLLLGDRIVLIGTGIDLDPGQQHWQLEVLQVGRLLDDVLARKIIAGLFQDLDRGLRD